MAPRKVNGTGLNAQPWRKAAKKSALVFVVWMMPLALCVSWVLRCWAALTDWGWVALTRVGVWYHFALNDDGTIFEDGHFWLVEKGDTVITANLSDGQERAGLEIVEDVGFFCCFGEFFCQGGGLVFLPWWCGHY
jgi:hypothetical protein